MPMNTDGRGATFSATAFATASARTGARSGSTPTTRRVLSSTPKTIVPPRPFANATTVLTHFLLSVGGSRLNSSVAVSPA